jgi:hypothetical protein
VLGQGTTDGDHLAMCGRVVIGAPEIASERDDIAVAHDHGSEWIIGLARLLDCHPHEVLVLVGGTP